MLPVNYRNMKSTCYKQLKENRYLKEIVIGIVLLLLKMKFE